MSKPTPVPAEPPSPEPGARPIAITMGDPAGVGPELCLRVLRNPEVQRRCRPLVFGDAGVLVRVAQACGLGLPACVLAADEWWVEGGDQPAVVDLKSINPGGVTPGRVSAECGRAAVHYISAAVEEALKGRVAAVVTAPIHKQSLRVGGSPHPGHTEMIAELTGSSRSCMLMASPGLCVSFVTTHIGLAEVAGDLTTQRIEDVIELTSEALQKALGKKPRLAVCALNPHAGEGGLFGNREEERVIAPAIARAKRDGILVEGPFPADSLFVPDHRRAYDGIVSLYHDQGQIPFKMQAFEDGVNITLGLPIVRTSVSHGTAFDIAWQGKANPRSLEQAIFWALRLGEG